MLNHPGILAEIREKIKYVMVDEYQDTNYIQELIVFLIAGESENICVVGMMIKGYTDSVERP